MYSRGWWVFEGESSHDRPHAYPVCTEISGYPAETLASSSGKDCSRLCPRVLLPPYSALWQTPGRHALGLVSHVRGGGQATKAGTAVVMHDK